MSVPVASSSPSIMLMNLEYPSTIRVQLISHILSVLSLWIAIQLYQKYQKASLTNKANEASTKSLPIPKTTEINAILILLILLFALSYIEYEFTMAEFSEKGSNRIRGRKKTILLSHYLSELILYAILSIISCTIMYKMRASFRKDNRCSSVFNYCSCICYPFSSALRNRERDNQLSGWMRIMCCITTVAAVLIITIKLTLFYIQRIDHNRFDADEYQAGYLLMDIIQIIFILSIIIPSFMSKTCIALILIMVILIVWYSTWFCFCFGHEIQALFCIMPFVLALFLFYFERFTAFAEYYLSILLNIMYTTSVVNVLLYFYQQQELLYILLQICLWIIYKMNCIIFIYQNKRRIMSTTNYNMFKYGEFVYISVFVERIVYGFKYLAQPQAFEYEYNGMKILHLIFAILPSIMLTTYYMATHNEALYDPRIAQCVVISLLNSIHIIFSAFDKEINLQNIAFPTIDHIKSPRSKALSVTQNGYLSDNASKMIMEDFQLNISCYENTEISDNDHEAHTPITEIEYDPMMVTNKARKVRNNDIMEAEAESPPKDRNLAETPLVADVMLPFSMETSTMMAPSHRHLSSAQSTVITNKISHQISYTEDINVSPTSFNRIWSTELHEMTKTSVLNLDSSSNETNTNANNCVSNESHTNLSPIYIGHISNEASSSASIPTKPQMTFKFTSRSKECANGKSLFNEITNEQANIVQLEEEEEDDDDGRKGTFSMCSDVEVGYMFKITETEEFPYNEHESNYKKEEEEVGSIEIMSQIKEKRRDKEHDYIYSSCGLRIKQRLFNVVLLLFILSDAFCRSIMLFAVLWMIESDNISDLAIATIFMFIVCVYGIIWQMFMMKRSQKLNPNLSVDVKQNQNQNDDNNNEVKAFTQSRKMDDLCLLMEDNVIFAVFVCLFSSALNLIHCLNVTGFVHSHNIDFSKWLFEHMVRIILSFIFIVICTFYSNVYNADFLIYLYFINLFINIVMLIQIKLYIVKSIKIKLLWDDIWITR